MFGIAVMSKPSARFVARQMSTAPLLRIRRLERRQPAQIVNVRVRRLHFAFGAEQLLEPGVAKPAVGIRRRIRRGDERALELVQRDRLLLRIPPDRIGIAGDVGLEQLARLEQRAPIGIERGRPGALELAELFAVGVGVEDCELRLRGAQRQLLAAERDARTEDRVLERILLLRDLRRDDAGLARLAQPVEAFALVAPALPPPRPAARRSGGG